VNCVINSGGYFRFMMNGLWRLHSAFAFSLPVVIVSMPIVVMVERKLIF
jgi:hypothetical protein